MNGRMVTLGLINALHNIPMGHDGLGRTASVKGVIKYQRDMRVMLRMMGELEHMIITYGVTSSEVADCLGEIIATSQEMKHDALRPSSEEEMSFET